MAFQATQGDGSDGSVSEVTQILDVSCSFQSQAYVLMKYLNENTTETCQQGKWNRNSSNLQNNVSKRVYVL